MRSMAVAQALPPGGGHCSERVGRAALNALRSAVTLLSLPVLSGRGRCRARVCPRAERPVLGGCVPAVWRWSSAVCCGSLSALIGAALWWPAIRQGGRVAEVAQVFHQVQPGTLAA